MSAKQIIVLIILAFIACVIFSSVSAALAIYWVSEDSNFPYFVRVQELSTGQKIPKANVIIEVGGLAPLDGLSDDNGIVRIEIPNSYSQKAGRLIVEAIGYQQHRQEINLTEGSLPDTISLTLSQTQLTPSGLSITSTPTPVPTNTPTLVIQSTPPTVVTSPPESVEPSVTNAPTTGTNQPVEEGIPESSALPIGQTWSQQGLSAVVTDFELKDYGCVNNTGANWHVWAEWKLTITNNTEQDLVIRLTEQDFTFTDNTGHTAEYYVVPDSYEYCNWLVWPGTTVKPPGKIDVTLIKRDESIYIRVYGIGTVESQEWYEFGIKDAGRIQNAEWHIDIPR